MSAHIGKIGHLPSQIRERLNLAIHEGLPGVHLVDWLNTLPEVQAILARDFGGRPITRQNLSKWRQTGYREWKEEQMFKEALLKAADQQFQATRAELAASATAQPKSTLTTNPEPTMAT